MDNKITLPILIIDDNKDNVFSLSALLKLHKMSFDVAYSGQEGITKTLLNNYGLIILDVQMPYMDGFEVAQKLFDVSDDKKTPILFLSALAVNKNDIKKGLSLGAVDYIVKPFDADMLIMKVKTILRLSETEKQLRNAKLETENLNLKLAEKARINKFSFDAMFYNSNDLIFVFNMAGIIIDCNKKTIDFGNMPSKKIIGKHFHDLPFKYAFVNSAINPDELHKNALLNKNLYDENILVEVSNTTKGKVFYELKTIKAKAENDEDLFMVKLRNCTQRIIAEQNLIKSNERYELINSVTNDAIYEWDAINDVFIWGEGFEKIFGYNYKLNEFKLHDWENLMYPKDNEVLKPEWKEFISNSNQDKWNKEYRFKRSDGSYAWVEETAKLLRNENGKAIRIVGVLRDISETKELRSLLDSAMELTQLGGWEIDFINKYAYLSPVARNIFEISNEFAVNSDTIISFFRGDFNKSVKTIFESAIRENKIFEFEAPIITQNNTEKWVKIVGNVEHIDQKHSKLFGSIRDITARKVTEIELNETLAKLQAVLSITENRNERLQNFAYIVSHNLRSHSGNIKGLLELLDDSNPELNENEVMQLIRKASDNLTQTVGNLADVAIKQISQIQNLEIINLSDVVNISLSTVVVAANKNKIQLFNKIENTVLIKGIKAYVESIILNFITNAIKYCDANKDGYVKLYSYYHDNDVVLVIEDNGLGIDLDKNKESLFGLYKTFNNNKEAMGVGLFISKNQIESIGGRISVESTLGKGTTFKIYFKNGKS